MKEKINKLAIPKETRLSTLKVLLWICCFILLLLGLARFSIVGQGIDDIFRFLFGWTKYLIYILVILLLIRKARGIKFNTEKIKKTTLIKSFWIIFNFYWFLGLIGAIIWNVENGEFTNYFAYLTTSLVPKYAQKWLDSSIYEYAIVDAQDFFRYHYSFSQVFDSGGVLGISVASISCFLSVFVALLFNFFSWFLLTSYIRHNSVWFYFLSQQKRNRIRWQNLNENRQNQMNVSIFNEVENQDFTIELQTARKIQIQDREKKEVNVNQIEQKHQESPPKQTETNSVQKIEVDLEQKQKVNSNPNWQSATTDEKFLDWIVKTEIELSDEDKRKSENNKDEMIEKLPSPDLFSNLQKDGQNTPEEKTLTNDFINPINQWKEVVKKIPDDKNKLMLAIGQNSLKEIAKVELNKIFHIFIDENQNEKKDQCLKTIISSLIYKHTPTTLKLLIINHKKTKLDIFESIPHLLAPIVENNKLVVTMLEQIIAEIKKRLTMFAHANVSDITKFNQEKPQAKKMPFIVLIIDNLVHLILIYQSQITEKTIKIMQLGGLAGVFLITTNQKSFANNPIQNYICNEIMFANNQEKLNTSKINETEANVLYLTSPSESKKINYIWTTEAETESLITFWKQKNYKKYYWKAFINSAFEN